MSLITAVLSVPARFGAERLAAFDRHIRMAAGIASLAVGLLLAHRVGVHDGLFAATPTWTAE